MSRKGAIVSEYRQAVNKLIQSMAELELLEREITLAGGLSADDISEQNSDITAEQFTAARVALGGIMAGVTDEVRAPIYAVRP